jgi:putative ABC transport system permease protein
MGSLSNDKPHNDGLPERRTSADRRDSARRPPRWATWLMSRFSPAGLEDELQGDLLEMYAYWVKTNGVRAARWRYGLATLRLIRPFTPSIPKQTCYYSQPSSFHPAMLRNYLKIALRQWRKNKLYSAINMLGLSIGLATCLLISLFVFDEFSYDRYNRDADRIVRVVLRGTLNGEQIREANVMAPVAQTLQDRFPEIQSTTRLRSIGTPTITYGDKIFRDTQFAFADSTLLHVFTLPLLKGDAQRALARPNTLIISQQAAKKIFGTIDPMGKVVALFDNKTLYTITGVMANVPPNSHFHFDGFASMTSLAEANSSNWLQSNFFTYLLLAEGRDYRQLEAKLGPVVETHMLPPLEKLLGVSRSAFRQKGTNLGLFLQPLTDVHLYSDLKPETELEPGGDIRYVYLFGAIALFMLLLACINFMNLSTAGATKRAREVGIRKVLGSERNKLIAQFLAESSLLTSLSLILAVGLTWALLPFFNTESGKELNLNLGQMPCLVPAFVLVGILVSGLAGSYPAFFLSSFKPIVVLKGSNTPMGRGSIGLRSSLVVFQFFISISLMIGTMVVYRQLHYIQSTKLGYDKDQVMVLEGTRVLGKNETLFARQLAQDSRVSKVSVSGFLPNNRYQTGLIAMQPEGQEAKLTRLAYFGIDDQYIPTLNMTLAVGRNFSAAFPSDSSGVIINQTAARLFGWTKNVLGRTLTNPALPANGGKGKTYRVIGVVNDFHFRSLHEQIAPLVMVLGDNSGSIVVKFRAKEVTPLLASLQRQWNGYGTGEPFTYSFLDEIYQSMHQSELRTGHLLLWFAGLTIFIACLGLFGLATFTAEQRTKEIGVRKVLGASVGSIVSLLSKDFLKLVFLALVIASPVGWYAMSRWLQNFAYKINLEWWVFVLAGLLAVGVTLLTVSYQSIKAALVNPVKSLRSE